MTRIPPWLFRQARKHSLNTATLLPACKDLESATNELRWIREHVEGRMRMHQQARKDNEIARLCRRRGKGVPLQYILGSQPFGSLNIKCKPGVLIPRPETEAYTCHLIDLLKSGKPLVHENDFNIVDFCSGTGCIPLLLYSSLQERSKTLNVLGVDASPEAVKLAEENIAHNINSGRISKPSPGQNITFTKGDIFQNDDIKKLFRHEWDIMISNPPYISRKIWNFGLGHLGYSVRKYEPSLALVPGHHLPVPSGWNHEDVFYARLLDIAYQLKPKVILFEIGDEEQARRVIEGFSRHTLSDTLRADLWRDWPDLTSMSGEENSMRIHCEEGKVWDVPIKGSGQIRSILLTRKEDSSHDCHGSVE